MRKIFILPLLGIISGFLISYLYPQELFPIASLLIFVSSLLLIWLGRKTYARMVQFQPFTPISQPVNLDCPKCGNKLRSTPGQIPPLYACLKCGYHGPIGLEPKGIKRNTVKKSKLHKKHVKKFS
jgi:hypothetical protein